MVKHAAHKLVLALTLLALTMCAGRAFAQSTTTAPSPSGVTGTDPVPQGVTGTDPVPQGVTGTDPVPQGPTGTDPETQSTAELMILQILE